MTIQNKSFFKWILGFVERHEALLVILCMVAIFRLPGLFEPNRYADEDIYLTIGQGLRKGLVLYRDIYDNKTPLIYVVAAVAGNVMWFRFILMVWNLVNVTLIYGLAKKLVRNKWAVVLSTVLFAIFSTIPLLEGEMANGELFMIMPVTAAIYLLFTKTGHISQERIKYLLAGILWSIGFLFKSPPAIELFGFVFFYLIYSAHTFSEFRKLVFDKRIWLLALGFAIPIIMSIVYFYLKGVGEIYIRSALLQNISYLSSWGGDSGKSSLLAGGLFTRGILMALALAIIFGLRKRLGTAFGFVSIWTTTALFGAMLSGRPYPHYLIEMVGPMSLLFSMMIFNSKVVRNIVGVGLFGVLVLAVVRYDFWYYKSLPYYVNFVSYIFGQKTKDRFYRFWGENVITNYQVSQYIGMVTDKDDKIFVWGTQPAIYVISKRLPAGKYTVSYHIFDLHAQEEIVETLIKEKTRLIVVDKNEAKFGELTGLISTKYVLTKTFQNISIYQLIR